MNKTWLALTTALTLMAGVASAQTMTTTTTESTTAVPVPVMPVAPTISESTTQRTVDSDGVVTDHSKTMTSGTTISPYGDSTSTRRTTETTTVR
jgi:hypothetical protein